MTDQQNALALRTDAMLRELAQVHDVPLRIFIEVGRLRLRVRDLVKLAPGSVIELKKNVDNALRAQGSEGVSGCPTVEKVIVLKRTGTDVEIRYEPARQDDPTRRRPDISRARQELGWEPRVSLDEGMQRTVSWFRETLGAPVGGAR